MKQKNPKPRPSDSLLFKGLFPTKPGVEWTRQKALKRVTAGRKFAILRRLLNTHEEFESFCAALGFIELNWALYEQSIDHSVNVIFTSLGGTAIDDKIPRLYSQKDKFLRRALGSMAILGPYKEIGVEILNRAAKLARTRHDLMHSVATHLKPVNGEYVLAKIDYEKDRHVYRDVVFAAKDFPGLAERLTDLGADATRWGLSLLELEARVLRLSQHR